MFWVFCELRMLRSVGPVPGRHAAAPATCGSRWCGGLTPEGEGLAEETAGDWEAQGVLDLLRGHVFFPSVVWWWFWFMIFCFGYCNSLKTFPSTISLLECWSWKMVAVFEGYCRLIFIWVLSFKRWLSKQFFNSIFSGCAGVSTFHVIARSGQPFWLMPNATFLVDLIGCRNCSCPWTSFTTSSSRSESWLC